MSEQTARFTQHNDQVVFEPARDLHWTAADAIDQDVTFEDAEKAIAALNEQNFGGFNDWRLPTVEELFLLADRTKYNPAIDTDFFPTCKSRWYWTSTVDAEDLSEYAWIVSFSRGHSYNGHRSSNLRVRAVRGPSRQ